MIESFGDKETENIFRSNWSGLLKSHDLGPLERCFFDLLKLDAAYNLREAKKLFGDRLVTMAEANTENRFAIKPRDENGYEIIFVWDGADKLGVSAKLSQAMYEGEENAHQKQEIQQTARG